MAEQDPLEEFWAEYTEFFHFQATAMPSGCLELQKMKTNAKGYPDMRVTIPNHGRKHLLAARLMFMVHHRQLQIDGDISHLCHNKLCVNVEHLVNEDRQTNLSRKHCNKDRECSQKHQPYCIFP
jgi:hypothetical protein